MTTGQRCTGIFGTCSGTPTSTRRFTHFRWRSPARRSCSTSSRCGNYDENSIFNVRITIHISNFKTSYYFHTVLICRFCCTECMYYFKCFCRIGVQCLKGTGPTYVFGNILSWFQSPFFNQKLKN